MRKDLIDVAIKSSQNTFENSFKLNNDKYSLLMEIYSFLRDLIDEEGGGFKEFEVSPERPLSYITAEVDTIDLYRTYLQDFIKLSESISQFKVTNSGKDSVFVTVGIKGLWEEV